MTFLLYSAKGTQLQMFPDRPLPCFKIDAQHSSALCYQEDLDSRAGQSHKLCNLMWHLAQATLQVLDTGTKVIAMVPVHMTLVSHFLRPLFLVSTTLFTFYTLAAKQSLIGTYALSKLI